MPAQVEAVSKFLEESLTPWFSGTFPGNAFLYDSTWGGVVTSNGAKDQVRGKECLVSLYPKACTTLPR